MKPYNLLVVIFLRLLSALPFAIYYSSLQLYLLDVGFSQSLSTSLVGIILALSFGSALAGGAVGGRYISFNALFVFGLICQAIGCFSFITADHNVILWLCSLFLLGSAGITVSLNMLITKQYEATNTAREKSFFWLYMALNIGYLIGYSLAGYYGITSHYCNIPILIAITSIVAIGITLFHRKIFEEKVSFYFYKFMLITAALFFVIRLLLQFSQEANITIVSIWVIICIIMFLILIRKYPIQKNQVVIFYILLFSALIFWSVYFLAPMALIVFIKYQVDLKIFGIYIAPQWVQNINTLVIILGTAFLGWKSKVFSSRSITIQFSAGLVCMGLGTGALALGIFLTVSPDKVGLFWVVLSYTLQSIGELLIGPIGYALIGRLIPESYHSIMMGVWITVLGIASIISSRLSTLAPYSTESSRLILGHYQSFFLVISIIAVVVAAIVYQGSKRFIQQLR